MVEEGLNWVPCFRSEDGANDNVECARLKVSGTLVPWTGYKVGISPGANNRLIHRIGPHGL